MCIRDRKIAVPIPYDFDFSALVGTPYATPHTLLPIEDIRDRYYLGPCREENALDPTFELFREKKTAILSTVEQFDLLDPKAKKSMLQYLNSFFDILENPKAYNSQIVEHCNLHIKP